MLNIDYFVIFEKIAIRFGSMSLWNFRNSIQNFFGNAPKTALFSNFWAGISQGKKQPFRKIILSSKDLREPKPRSWQVKPLEASLISSILSTERNEGNYLIFKRSFFEHDLIISQGETKFWHSEL